MKADADVDKLLVEGIESLEEYLDDHEVACTNLKKGFLMQTKAKLRLPEHALSEISYHEELEASRVVTLDSEGNWRLQDATEAKLQKVDKKCGGASLHHRRAGTSNQHEDPVNAVSSKTGSNLDTLLWFSSLPPSDLRQAQKQFSSGTLLFGSAPCREDYKLCWWQRNLLKKFSELFMELRLLLVDAIRV